MTKTLQKNLTSDSSRTSKPVLHGVVLSILCAVSYWLITHLLSRAFPVSRDDELLGGMWAVIATIFVYRYSYEQSVAGALSRMAATALSFVLCFVYLRLFPFHIWGMAALIGVGAIVMSVLGRPDDVITTGITTAVVMVVAAISPAHAWKQPLLRMVDTVVGSGIALVGARVTRGQITAQSPKLIAAEKQLVVESERGRMIHSS